MTEAAASAPRALAAVADQPRVHDFLAQAIAEGRLDDLPDELRARRLEEKKLALGRHL